MPAAQIASPFGGEPVDEIPLAAAPLVKVLAQVKFPSLSMLRDESVINSYTSLLGHDYPLRQDRRGINFFITANGISQEQSNQRLSSMQAATRIGN
jgi:uncharacterized protein (TIGR04255 family)